MTLLCPQFLASWRLLYCICGDYRKCFWQKGTVDLLILRKEKKSNRHIETIPSFLFLLSFGSPQRLKTAHEGWTSRELLIKLVTRQGKGRWGTCLFLKPWAARSDRLVEEGGKRLQEFRLGFWNGCSTNQALFEFLPLLPTFCPTFGTPCRLHSFSLSRVFCQPLCLLFLLF